MLSRSWSRFDNVKVAISDDDDNTRLRFGRCLVFCKDQKDKHFCLLRWYEEVHTHHPAVLLPQLKLAPSAALTSYDVQPVESIVNGTLVVESDGTFWALQSPREIEMNEKYNNWRFECNTLVIAL